MRNNQTVLNKQNVYKLVNKRFGMVLLLILIMVGTASYFIQQNNLLNAIENLAVQRSALFVENFGQDLNDPAAVDNGLLQKRVDQFVRPKMSYSEGFFSSALIIDKRGIIAAKYQQHSDVGIQEGEAKILQENVSTSMTSTQKMVAQRVTINNSLFVLLRFPINNSNTELLGHIVLLFKPSTEELNKIQRSIWRATLSSLLVVLLTILAIYPVIIRLTKELSTLSTNLLIANLQTAKALGNAIAKKDSDTDSHNYRVTIYAVRLAEAIKLDKAKMQGLIKGAFLHDVGKIGTPDSILLKPGKLTDTEFSEMKNHVSYGVDIIKSSAWLKDAEDVVMHHHEKFNGSGYSDRAEYILSGEDIPLVARIFAIVDVFDALTSHRPYKKPFDFEPTIVEMEKTSGSHFDPELFTVFKTIARPLYDQLADREDELPRTLLTEIVYKYFLDDLEAML